MSNPRHFEGIEEVAVVEIEPNHPKVPPQNYIIWFPTTRKVHGESLTAEMKASSLGKRVEYANQNPMPRGLPGRGVKVMFLGSPPTLAEQQIAYTVLQAHLAAELSSDKDVLENNGQDQVEVTMKVNADVLTIVPMINDRPQQAVPVRDGVATFTLSWTLQTRLIKVGVQGIASEPLYIRVKMSSRVAPDTQKWIAPTFTQTGNVIDATMPAFDPTTLATELEAIEQNITDLTGFDLDGTLTMLTAMPVLRKQRETIVRLLKLTQWLVFHRLEE